MAGKGIDGASTFQSTRVLLDKTIREIIECVESKQIELSSQIDIFENDDKFRQNEIASDIEQLDQLKKHTDGLAKNSLSDLQEKVLEDITMKITKLQFESDQTPELKLNFDNDSVIAGINGMSIVGCEFGSLECDSDEIGDDTAEGVPLTPTDQGKKGRRNYRGGRGRRGRKSSEEVQLKVCECDEKDCELIIDEISDKKKKKYKPQKVEDNSKADTKREKNTPKKSREDRNSSQGENSSPHVKKGRNKGKGISSFESHSALIDSD